MCKGERISQLVGKLLGEDVDPGAVADSAKAALAGGDIAEHPFYRAYFQCWNEQHYYEAHDVLEQLWLKADSPDADFFKGLIQAAGGFVHLQKNFEQPSHPKHSRRLQPAVRLLRLAEKNLSIFAPRHHGLDVAAFCRLLHEQAEQIVASDYETNPWSPEAAPKLQLG
jgi:predicted metal-dependent hydrolase